MAYGFKPVVRDQPLLLPPDVNEWVPGGHPARFVLDAVEQLDLSKVEAGYRLGGAGRAAYDPAMLTALLLYAYAIGVRSSRAIERACHSDVAFMLVAGLQRPDHATIARFRAAHRHALEGLHVQVVGLCVKAGLVEARVVSVDSTKVAANAAGTANVTREQLEALAREAFEEAAAIDAAEDARLGAGQRGDELAPGWEEGPGRASKIAAALRELDEQAQGQREIDQRQAARVAKGHKPKGRKPLPADPSKPWRVASKQRKQDRKANLTDPQSRMMKTPKGWAQSYTCQAVTCAGQIILAADVTNDQNDNRALLAMLIKTRGALAGAGGDPQRLRAALADKGYWNHDEIDRIENELGIITLVATVKDRDLRDTDPPPPPSQPSLAKMHQRLQHPTGRRFYQRRSAMIEPVFGQRKHNRGLRQFLGRGLDAVRGEWMLEVIGHNLTKLWRAQPSPA